MNEINITSAQYLQSGMTGENSGIKVVIDDQILFVPLDPANRHYAEIQKQVAAGTLTIADAD
jgi:hypothetical protein